MDIDWLDSALTPLVFGAGFVLVSVVRSYWLWRTAGIASYVIDHDDPLHRYLGQVFAAVVAGFFLYFGASAVWPSLLDLAGQPDWAMESAPRSASVALMMVATIWTSVAQIHMGRSWRIGIPAGEVPKLRVSGPFSVSRNPIFLGMLIFVVGLTLWSPSVVSVSLLVATTIAIEVQIRCEEAFLERTLGSEYRTYRLRVRRWL